VKFDSHCQAVGCFYGIATIKLGFEIFAHSDYLVVSRNIIIVIIIPVIFVTITCCKHKATAYYS
jgi:hypothetical protein